MVKGTNERGEQSHYIFNGLGHLVAQEMIVERGAHGFGDVYAEPSPQINGVVTFARHESAVVRGVIELDDNRETVNGHTPIRSAESCNVSEHIARGLPHTIVGANDHSQCRRDQVCAHANVRVPEIDRDRFMVMHREFVLDYTSEMVNTIMEFERGVNGLTYRYVYGAPNVFGLQTRESVTVTGEQYRQNWLGRTSTSAVNETFFYHHNRLGSSVMLTNANGRVVSSVEYDSWGRPVNGSMLTIGNREIDLVTRYTGHRYDPVVGMYYARFRMYDPTIRRFTAIDPIRGTVLMPHTMVQYTYVLNNPVRYIDPWGLFCRASEGYTWSEEQGTYLWNYFGELSNITPPPPPCFQWILEEVYEWLGSMTDDELMFAIGTGLFEAMGVYIPSDWVRDLASGGHFDFNEFRQSIVEMITDTIIEDSSGQGIDLLNGWGYFPGNSWHQTAGSSDRSVNMPELSSSIGLPGTGVLLEYILERNAQQVAGFTYSTDRQGRILSLTINGVAKEYRVSRSGVYETGQGRLVFSSDLLMMDFGLTREQATHQAGDRFNTLNDAVVAWALTYYPRTVTQGIEFGAMLHGTEEDGFFWGDLVTGARTNINLSYAFDAATEPVVATIHTHPNIFGYNPNSPSRGDRMANFAMRVPGYIATPNSNVIWHPSSLQPRFSNDWQDVDTGLRHTCTNHAFLEMSRQWGT